MIKILIDQVQRLFSSKKNAGRYVYKQTDRLHDFKLVLIALSIGLLVGYSQFRANFSCTGFEQDEKHLTNFCWINGTTTHIAKWAGKTHGSYLHIGINFKLKGGRYEPINHNYMRSSWLLLMLMAVCSFLAQRDWSAIFRNDTLIALLKLPGHEELSIVHAAQKTRPYETLCNLPTKQEATFRRNLCQQPTQTITVNDKPACSYTHSIEILAGDANEHQHALDFYVDQLICLLITKRASAYKLSELELRRKLILHSLWSTLLTVMQFVLPWLFIGDEYRCYGWNYFKFWLKYVLDLCRGAHAQMNTIDYFLSAHIWPTMAQCEYVQHGNHKPDRSTVLCSIPINEICGKLFAVIWWVIVINIFIEIHALIVIIFCSTNHAVARWTFGRKYWPHVSDQALSIATFRYRRYLAMHPHQPRQSRERRRTNSFAERRQGCEGEPSSSTSSTANYFEPVERVEISDRDRKSFEAQARRTNSCLRGKKWYFRCTRDIGVYLSERGTRVHLPNVIVPKRRTLKDGEGFREVEENVNVYYLLYLLYLRLDCSRRKVEHVIRATSRALNRYLESLPPINLDEESIDLDQPNSQEVSHKSSDSDKSKDHE